MPKRRELITVHDIECELIESAEEELEEQAYEFISNAIGLLRVYKRCGQICTLKARNLTVLAEAAVMYLDVDQKILFTQKTNDNTLSKTA